MPGTGAREKTNRTRSAAYALYRTDRATLPDLLIELVVSLAAEQAAFDLPGRCIVRVILQPLPLEVLHRVAVFGEFLTDRVAEDGQTAMCGPVVAETEAEPVAGRRIEGAVGVAARLDRREW